MNFLTQISSKYYVILRDQNTNVIKKANLIKKNPMTNSKYCTLSSVSFLQLQIKYLSVQIFYFLLQKCLVILLHSLYKYRMSQIGKCR